MQSKQMQYGRAIREARVARGLSVNEMARRAGISHAMLSMIEKGDRSPSLASLEWCAGALSLTVADLVVLASDEATVPAHWLAAVRRKLHPKPKRQKQQFAS